MKHKSTATTLIALASLVATLSSSHAWFKMGYVFCDANTNGIIDVADVPVPGVLVVVTNTTGGTTFSNANWTTPEGFFIVQLPDQTDSYLDYIHPLTLPNGTVSVAPSFATFTISSQNDSATNYFLITNPNCVNPNPPVGATNACWLTGGGTIRIGTGKPAYTFGGNVYPGCNSQSGDGGNLNVIAHNANLHFQGTVIEVVDCGNVPGIPAGSKSPKTPYNYIEFTGMGSLKGIGKNKANYGVVYFHAGAEDRKEPGKGSDRLYLRVHTEQGQTLLLISGQPGAPTAVAPTPISTGNLQIHVSSCDNPPNP